ncbi:putative peptide zinc metalloprotease protein [Streptomyces sp. TLI_235]|nr:hypothetical protein [Streptomyces sp. TLI_235]PBC76981.1 putative peptide zinc metalloprotease protein [Streptomyces sp. TLI_235]
MTESGKGLGSPIPTAAERIGTVGGTRRPAEPDPWARPGAEPPPDPPPDAGPSPLPGPQTAAGPPQIPDGPPQPAAGLVLQGEYQDSGFTTPRYLVQRADGQMVQLTRLLYLVTGAMDGTRSHAEIAQLVSGPSGHDLGAEHIAQLVEHKLRPMGLVAAPAGSGARMPLPVTDLLLTLRAHRVLLRPPSVNTVAAALSWLHRPAAVLTVLLLTAAADVWLFAVHGAMTPVLHTVQQPTLLLAVFALTLLSTVFHEFGHASGCRHGGGRPGCIGCGIYLVWPAMYTDVTDVYRLRRPARLRTDLGGVYFNVVFAAVLFAAYAATGQDFLLAAVYLTHFEIVEQLLPVLRFDGYYILADLAGVPDLFGKVGPILRSMVPGRPAPPEVAGLKRSSRITVTAWVVTMVPLLALQIGYVLWNLPRLVQTGVRSFGDQAAATASALSEGALASAALGAIGACVLILPTVGLLYLMVQMARRGGRALSRAHRSRRGRAVLLLVAAASTGAALAFVWGHRPAPAPLAPRPPPVPTPAPAGRTELSLTPSAVLTDPPSATEPPTPTVDRTRRSRPTTAAPRPRPGRSATSAPAPRAAVSPSATPPPAGPSATAPSTAGTSVEPSASPTPETGTSTGEPSPSTTAASEPVPADPSATPTPIAPSTAATP